VRDKVVCYRAVCITGEERRRREEGEGADGGGQVQSKQETRTPRNDVENNLCSTSPCEVEDLVQHYFALRLNQPDMIKHIIEHTSTS
jgi:hypothetical protein